MNNILFLEQNPSNELLSYVHSYWLGNFNIRTEKKFSQLVLPNGCIELIIHLTDAHCNLNKYNKSWDKSPDYIILGMYTKPYEVKFSQNVKVFGIRFYPDGIQNIFGIPPAKFLTTYENSTDVFGKSFEEFCNRIREAKTFKAQINRADNFLITALGSNCLNHDFARTAMQIIRKAKGIINYNLLSKEIPVSSRQLQRKFKSQYGVTVSDYARLSRMNAVHNYMLSQKQSLTELSYKLNFSDQSHMIREFKNYVGVAPREFLKNKKEFLVNPAISTN